jgi:transposase-like protein
MAEFSLSPTADIGDLTCPHCGQEHDIDWVWTEYGDPIEGRERTHCRVCGKNFYVSTEVHVSYKTTKE